VAGALSANCDRRQVYNHLNSLLGPGRSDCQQRASRAGHRRKLFMSDDTSVKADKALDQINTILADLRAQKGTMASCSTIPHFTIRPKKRSPMATPCSVTFAPARARSATGHRRDSFTTKLRDASSNLSEANRQAQSEHQHGGKAFSDPSFTTTSPASRRHAQAHRRFPHQPKKFLHINLPCFKRAFLRAAVWPLFKFGKTCRPEAIR